MGYSKETTCSVLTNLIFRYFPFALQGEFDVLRFVHKWLNRRLTNLGARPRFIPANLYDARTAIEAFADKLRKPWGEEDPIDVESAAILTPFLSEGISIKVTEPVVPLLRAIFNRCWVEIDGLAEEPEYRPEVIRLCGRGLS